MRRVIKLKKVIFGNFDSKSMEFFKAKLIFIKSLVITRNSNSKIEKITLTLKTRLEVKLIIFKQEDHIYLLKHCNIDDLMLKRDFMTKTSKTNTKNIIVSK